jgi:hypothetical protein
MYLEVIVNRFNQAEYQYELPMYTHVIYGEIFIVMSILESMKIERRLTVVTKFLKVDHCVSHALMSF